MDRTQLFLIGILCAISLPAYLVAEKVEQDHRDSHHEKDFTTQYRAKRYATGTGRVPMSYLYNQLGDDNTYAMEKRYRSNLIPTNPVATHFRELQVRQVKRPFVGEGSFSPSQMQSYRDLLQLSDSYRNAAMNGDLGLDMTRRRDDQSSIPTVGSDVIGPLSDDELRTLLLLLEEDRLQGKAAPLRNFYTPQAQYFTPEMKIDNPGKRETGKRTNRIKEQLVLEQPMSFENSITGDTYPVFLNQKRSKRVGNPGLNRKSQSLTRIKKETDPAVEADLDKIFAGVSSTTEQQVANHTSRHSSSIPTTAISSSNQIPPPSSSQIKSKKAIDWSNYFGIDKRQENIHASSVPGAKVSSLSQPNAVNLNKHNNIQSSGTGEEATHKQQLSEKSDKTTVSTTVSSSVPAKNDGAHRDSDVSIEVKDKKAKEKKETSNKMENDADEKADRKWILKEFYKNLAMTTNVKRKRESPASDTRNDLENLEKIERKMEEVGDQIIWDALKYTGAHKDAELSPDELAHVKNEVIHKLAAAYSLEKVREAIEEFRQQLGQLKDKQQYY